MTQAPDQKTPGDHAITANGPLPDDLHETLTKINNAGWGAH
jgi:hypothetical protein